MKDVNLDDFLNHVQYKGSTNYKQEKDNSGIDLENDIDNENPEPLSYEETYSERTLSGLIQTVVENIKEYEPEAITEPKSAENTAYNNLVFNINASVAKPHAIGYDQSTRLLSFSNFKENEVGYTELSTTKKGTEVGPDSFEGNMFSFDNSFQNVNFGTSVTENIMTYNLCDNDDDDEIMLTSSFVSQRENGNRGCFCDCNSNNTIQRKPDSSGKKKLTKILELLLHGPRPTFANKTKCLNPKTGKIPLQFYVS